MAIRWALFRQPDGREHRQIHVSDEPDWARFESVAQALELGLSGTWRDKLDGIDERYWDLVIGDGRLTLHLQHYLGITVYPTAGADADAESLAALEKAHGLLSSSRSAGSAKVNGGNVRRWVLTSLSSIIFLVGLGAFLVGGCGTLFAFSPANVSDAAVLIRYAPLYAVGGAAALAIAVVLWRLRGARQSTADPEG